jgi:hypothetical protein
LTPGPLSLGIGVERQSPDHRRPAEFGAGWVGRMLGGRCARSALIEQMTRIGLRGVDEL